METTEPLAIDKKLNNADWTKGTWDIDGVDSLPELLDYLEKHDMTPAGFMALPIYIRNVEKLSWLKQLATM